jgi:hypothetical protein
VQSAIILLLISEMIATLGVAAVTLYVFRRRDRERFLLWFGLFSMLYAAVLILRNSAFRLGFGQPQAIGLAIDHVIILSTAVPGLCYLRICPARWRQRKGRLDSSLRRSISLEVDLSRTN